MTDEPVDHADGRSRRSAFAKIGAVAAGAWVAPQVLSTPAASAQSAPPCACPVAYANVFNPTTTFVPPGGSVPFPSSYLPAVGIVASVFGTDFNLVSAGTYRVTYSQTLASSSGILAVALNGVPVPYTGLGAGQAVTTAVVLVTANVGDVLSIVNIDISTARLTSFDAQLPATTLLIELVT